MKDGSMIGHFTHYVSIIKNKTTTPAKTLHQNTI